MNNLGFGEMLKAYREKHNLTQKELAAMMNISSKHLSVLEREQKIPRAKTIEAFERLIHDEEVGRYMRHTEITIAERKEYAKLLACLDTLEGEKRKEAMEAIIRLLKMI